MKRYSVSPWVFLLTLFATISVAPAQQTPPAAWVQQARRWGQVNINELDAQRFDVRWWIDYFQRCHLDGVTVNAAGLVAYYPSQVPLHPRSRFLGQRDLFGEIVAAARKAHLRVLARFDPSYQREEFYLAHPDWFSVNREGKPNLLDWPPEPREKLYEICPNSPYFWEYMPKVFEEIFSRYDVDGIFGNAWEGYGGICYCRYCRERFQQDTGNALPAGEHRSDPIYRAWVSWRYRRLADVWQFWSETVKRVKSDAIFVPNQTSIAGMRGFIERGQEMLHIENQGRGPTTPLWQIGMTGKLLRELSRGERPYWLLVGYYIPGWRHIAKPEPEQRIWMAEALASGARPWFHVVGAAQEDRRGFQAFEDFFTFHWKNDRHFRGLRSLADVALVYSQPTLDFYRLPSDGGPLGAPPTVTESLRGAYQALLEARVPFDMLLAEDLEQSVPDRYRVLVLANTAMLSDKSIKGLEEFVQRGGGLLSTFETSRYDETGKRRPDFGLASLLGVRATADRVLGPLGHSYMRLQDSEELGDTFKDTAILPNTRYLVPVRAEAMARTPLWLVPPYPVYPPETSWTQIHKEDVPLAYFRAAGKGHVVYFPGDLAATYGATHLPDHGRLLQGAARWAGAGEPRASVEGAGLVDFTLYEQADGKHLVGFLVNLTNPAAWQPPLTEIIPVGPQVVTIRLRPGARCRAAQLLVAGQAPKFQQAGDVLTVTVPNLRDFEVVVLDLE
jgi:hypothetical protein